MAGSTVSLTRSIFQPDMVCYEGNGVPADIYLFNKRSDIENGVDPLVVRALKVLKSQAKGATSH